MSEAEPITPQPPVTLPDLPRNRLSIAQLMLWTLGSAIMLAGFRFFRQVPQQDPGPLDTVNSLYQLSISLPLGAQLGSVLLWGWNLVARKRGFPFQPGQWVLLVEGLANFLGLIGYAVCILAMNRLALVKDRDLTYLVVQLPVLIVSVVGYSWAWWSLRRESGIWKVAIACLVGQQALFLLAAFGALRLYLSESTVFGPAGMMGPMRLQTYCCAPASALLVGLAGISDLLHRRGQRDYLHWTGVLSLVVATLLQFLLPWIVGWALRWQQINSAIVL